MPSNLFTSSTAYPITRKPLTHPDNKQTYQDIFNLLRTVTNILSEKVTTAIESKLIPAGPAVGQLDFALKDPLYLGEQIGFEIIYTTTTSATHDLQIFLNDDVTLANYSAVINGAANSTATVANIGVSWAGTNRIHGVITPTNTETMIDVEVPWTQGALTQSVGSSRCTTQNLITGIQKISFVSTSTFDEGSMFSIYRITPWRIPTV